MPKSAQKDTADLTYEQAQAELEKLVEMLEGEQTSLDDAMKLFERGQVLLKHCAALLNKAELKVKQIAGDSLIEFSGDNDDR